MCCEIKCPTKLYSGFESVRNRLDWDFLGKYMFWMLVQGLVFFIATLLLEYRVWIYLLALRKKDNDAVIEEELELDEDVEEERNRVFSSDNADVLKVKNLFKTYRRNGKPAVNCLSFGVPRAQCFGLLGEFYLETCYNFANTIINILGVNGAGKTTTFKMLTGKIK